MDHKRKDKTHFVCQDCEYLSPKWVGRCPGCSSWNTMMEKKVQKVTSSSRGVFEQPSAISIAQVQQQKMIVDRWMTNLPELDRVLGGGLVPGSLVLVGGDPGVGKSTLWLQVASGLVSNDKVVLYVSGEESVTQLSGRAERLKAIHERLLVAAEVEMDRINALVERYKPHVLIIDSIQTMLMADIGGLPGSIIQIRACTGALLRLAKKSDMATIIVGHVTKAGELAGPRLLEHMVDAVLYLEGDRHHNDRLLRSVKNRFGSTCELGIFALQNKGFVGVTNPSQRFLADRPLGTAGTAIVATLEGTRPLLIEIQALVAKTRLAAPRRTVSGMDIQRLHLLIAVLEKRLGISLQQADIFLNVVGGLMLSEPASDLGAAVALVSSMREIAVKPYDAFVGEIGLTGEVRGVGRIENRVAELAQMGFKRAIIPSANLKGLSTNKGHNNLEIIGIDTLDKAIKVALVR